MKGTQTTRRRFLAVTALATPALLCAKSSATTLISDCGSTLPLLNINSLPAAERELLGRVSGSRIINRYLKRLDHFAIPKLLYKEQWEHPESRRQLLEKAKRS